MDFFLSPVIERIKWDKFANNVNMRMKVRSIIEFPIHWQENWGLKNLYDPSKTSLDINRTNITGNYFF